MTTASFKITPSAYARHLMRMWTRAHWWLVAVPPAVSLALAIAVDWKFLFVAVILVFIVIPHIMVTVYYYHALSPESAMSILPHKIAFEPDALRIIYEPDDTDNPDDSPRQLRDNDIIPRDSIKAVTTHKSDVILHLSAGKYRILVIPVSALPDGTLPTGYFINTRYTAPISNKNARK